MTEDEYVKSVLQRYAVNASSATNAANNAAPAIRRWAGDKVASLAYSGSFAKGTANNISTDIDLFISLKSSTQETLKEIYESLFRCANRQG